MFSNKDLKTLILPLIIEQFLAVTIGMANTIMVSSVGEAAVSGISIVESINLLLITMFSSIATGGAVVASQYIGKGEPWNANIVAKQLELSTLVISLVLSGLTLLFRNWILAAVFPGIAPPVMESAKIYFFISALSYPFLAVYNSGAALFRAMGNSKTSMLISILMNVLNISGNAIGIYGLHGGVAGASVPSLISRAVGAVIITILLANPNLRIHIDRFWKFEFHPKVIWKILSIGLPNGLENSVFQIGKILTMSIVASFGTMATTANAIAGNLASIQVIPGNAVSMALLTVVGQCIGAGEYDAAKKYVRKLMLIIYAAMAGFSALLLLFHKPLIGMYSLSGETGNLTAQLFFIHAVCAIAIWPLSFSLPNALRAAGDATFTMLVSLFSMWVFRIGLSFLLANYMGFGVYGIWIAMCVDWVCRSVFFALRFAGGKWRNRKLV